MALVAGQTRISLTKVHTSDITCLCAGVSDLGMTQYHQGKVGYGFPLQYPKLQM